MRCIFNKCMPFAVLVQLCFCMCPSISPCEIIDGPLWIRQAGSVAADSASRMRVDDAGNVYVAGITSGGLDGNISAGGTDLFLIKYDRDGSKLWLRQKGTSSNDSVTELKIDADGTIWLAGDTLSVQYDAAGTELGTDAPYAYQTDSQGNRYSFRYPAYNNVYLDKADQNGNPLWSVLVETSSKSVGINDSFVSGDGNIYISSFDGNWGGSHISKYDTNGNRILKQGYGPIGYAVAITADSSGNIYTAENQKYKKYDPAGLLLQTKIFTSISNDTFKGITTDSAGNIYLAGSTEGGLDGPNAGLTDTLVMKYGSYPTSDPSGTLVINGGAAYTGTTAVTLGMYCLTGGCDEMQFSNDSVFWSPPESYGVSRGWSLTAGSGVKTVYARFRSTAGTWSAASLDTITLDTTPPFGTIAINNKAQYANGTAVTLSLTAQDTSGVTDMQFSNDGTSWSAWETYATQKSWQLASGDGTESVSVRYRDNVGNVGTYTATIVLDTTPPAGSFTINGGAASTQNANVTLTLSATDLHGVVTMEVSNDGTTWEARPYATTASWTLTPGDGLKTVWARFIDQLNNRSEAVSATIVLGPPPHSP